jgi:hypothetical protein
LEKDINRLTSQFIELYRYGSTISKFNEWLQDCVPPMKVEVGDKTYHDLVELCKYLNIITTNMWILRNMIVDDIAPIHLTEVS